jgi:hypothetical protein
MEVITMVELSEEDKINFRNAIEQLDEIELMIKKDTQILGVNERKHILSQIKVVTELMVYIINEHEMVSREHHLYVSGLAFYMLDDISANISCQNIE